jgi:hypothetical protein
MRHTLRTVALTVMLAGCFGSGQAQVPAPNAQAADVNLTQAQELTILLRVESEQPQSGSAAPDVGATLPDGVALKRLPSDVGAQIPEAERFHYAKLEDRILLVDPSTKQVVKVIRPQAALSGAGLSGSSGTTGSGR